MLKCVTCKQEYHQSKFYKSQIGFRSPRCKFCMGKSIKSYYIRNKEKYLKINREYVSKNRETVRLRTHKSKLKLKYNMTVEEYDEILKKQNNVCAICKKPETIRDKRYDYLKKLCVDHCHKTGKNRGLLCDRCNTALGSFNESIENMKNAIKYIKAHQ